MLTQKITAGRTVHYVLPSGPSAGQHRPAVVIDARLLNPGAVMGTPCYVADLHVMMKPGDYTDSYRTAYKPERDDGPTMYVEHVPEDPSGSMGWHWPERE